MYDNHLYGTLVWHIVLLATHTFSPQMEWVKPSFTSQPQRNVKLFHIQWRVWCWVGLSVWLHTKMVYQQMITHLSTNWTWCRATSLPLSKTVTW